MSTKSQAASARSSSYNTALYRFIALPDGRAMAIERAKPQSDRLIRYIKKLLVRSDLYEAALPGPGEFPWQIAGEVNAGLLRRCGEMLQRKRRRAERHCPNDRAIPAYLEFVEENLQRAATLCERDRRRYEQAGPFILSDEQQRQLNQMLQQRGLADVRLVRLLAQMVAWQAGTGATEQFLNTAALVHCGEEVRTLRGQVEQLCCRLKQWERQYEPCRWRSIHEEMKAEFSQIHPILVQHLKLTTRLRGRTVAELCRELRGRCVRLSANPGGIVPRPQALGALAILAMTGGSAAVLPELVVHSLFSAKDPNEAFGLAAFLVQFADSPGYPQLMSVLEEFTTLPELHRLKDYQRLLAEGITVSRIQWLNQLPYYPEQVPAEQVESGYQFCAKMAEIGFELSENRVSFFLRTKRTNSDDAFLRCYRRWLERASCRDPSPKVVKNALTLLSKWLDEWWGLSSDFGELQSWVRIARHKICSSRDSCGRLNDLVDGIKRFRRFTGEGDMLPKSFRKMLDHEQKTADELVHLKHLVQQGKATAGQQQRCEYLRANVIARATPKRLLREAQEAYVAAGLDAFQHVIRQIAEKKWRDTAGTTWPHASLERLVALSTWVQEMNSSEHRTLRDAVTAANAHGPGYRRYLSANADWLRQAAREGIALDVWLNPPRKRARLCDQPVTICVSQDPLEIYRMGNYFNTCLSQGGCNQMSVLANAYHANKQVIYVYDEHGHPQARQLVALDSDFRLLGYHCYSGRDDNHRQCIELVADYCGQWAQRAGFQLADDDMGQPTSIGGHFWYDDGACTWDPRARQAVADLLAV